jgi:hypothetical protein
MSSSFFIFSLRFISQLLFYGPRKYNLILKKLSCLTLVIIIDDSPIATKNIVEESEVVRVLRKNLTCVINSNIIHCLKSLTIFSLLWFMLHNPDLTGAQ